MSPANFGLQPVHLCFQHVAFLNEKHNVKIVRGRLGKLKIDTSGGDDTVLVDSTIVDRRTKILTGWGNDDVTLINRELLRTMLSVSVSVPAFARRQGGTRLEDTTPRS